MAKTVVTLPRTELVPYDPEGVHKGYKGKLYEIQSREVKQGDKVILQAIFAEAAESPEEAALAPWWFYVPVGKQ